MSSFLYVLAAALIVCWAIGFFINSAGSLIHLLLLLAIVAFLFGLIRRPNAI